jgi:hypothetical protein
MTDEELQEMIDEADRDGNKINIVCFSIDVTLLVNC